VSIVAIPNINRVVHTMFGCQKFRNQLLSGLSYLHHSAVRCLFSGFLSDHFRCLEDFRAWNFAVLSSADLNTENKRKIKANI
jgi:hypothetical protein